MGSDIPLNSSGPTRRKASADSDLGTDRRKRQVRVAKREQNVIARVQRFLGFIYHITEVSAPHGEPLRWLVEMEAFREDWFLRIWRESEMQSLGAERLLELFAANTDFSRAFFGLNPEQRGLAFRLHRHFALRTILNGDPAPTSLIQFFIRPGALAETTLRESHWYGFVLGEPSPWAPTEDNEVPDMLAGYAELALNYENDPAIVNRPITALDLSELDALLKVLHLPQWDPATEPPPRGTPPPGAPPAAVPEDEPPPGSSSSGPAGGGRRGPLRAPLREAWESLRRFTDDWLAGPWGGPTLAPAGVPADFLRPSFDREHRPVSRPVEYHGSPTAAGVQMPNPMLPGAQQPFVGVLNVGQGNCNVLYGNNGEIVAYFDLGFPSPFYLATTPRNYYAPCFHNDPLIFLSSWDWDHCSMARRARGAWNLRWIIPQQHPGPASMQQVYAQTVAAAARGGIMTSWPGAAPGAAVAQHLPLPWGYVERGIPHDQIANRNEGGLVMYICVANVGVAPLAMLPAAAAVVAGRGAGPVPPAAHARVAANAASAAATLLNLNARVQAVAEAADRAVRQYAGLGVVPGAADIARAALAATGALVGRGGGGGWLAAFQAMSAIGGLPAAGTVNAAAALLVGALAPGAAAPTAAAAMGVAGVPAAVGGIAMGGPPPTDAEIALVLAIADAAVSVVAAGPAGPWPAALPAAQLVTAAVAAPPALNAGAAAALPAANVAVTNAVTALSIDAQVKQVASIAAGSAAEVVRTNGAAPLIPAAVYASASVAGVSRLVAADDNWTQAFLGMREAAAGGANAIHAAHAPGAYAVAIGGAGAASIAAAVPAIGAPPIGTFAVANLEALAAGAAICDAAAAVNASVNGIAAATPIAGGAAAIAQCAAEAGSPVIAHAAPVGTSLQQAAVATGQPVLAREGTSFGREAARQVFVALVPAAAANMPPQQAPLPPMGGFGAVPGVAVPGAGFLAGLVAVGAAAPGGAAVLGGLQAGTGPVNAAQRWILLTGDMSFSMMPTQTNAGGAWPVVIGMTATHHGANTCFPNEDERSYMPLAPGSPAAYASAAAGLTAPSGLANQVAAAAAAFAAADVAIHLQAEPLVNVLPMGAYAPATAAVAPALTAGAALTAMRTAAMGAFGVNAAATSLAALVGGGATAHATVAANAGCMAAILVGILAAELLDAALGAAMTTAIARLCAVQAVPALAGAAPSNAAVAATLARPAVVAAVTLAAGGAAAPGLLAAATVNAGAMAGTRWRRAAVLAAFAAALADARAAAAAGGAMPVGPSREARRAARDVVADAFGLAAAALPANSLPAAVLPPEGRYWPYGLGLAGTPQGLARFHAAATDGATEVHNPAAAVGAAARAAAASAAVAPLVRSQSIVYSYGVRNTPGNYRHYYGTMNLRHAHPWAVYAYVSRGWTQRRDTSINTWHSQQPSPIPLAGVFVSGGCAAIGWEVGGGYAGPARGDFVGAAHTGTFNRRPCPLCGNYHFVCC